MLNQPPLPAFAVVGAGAVGCYFGGMLARAGYPVTLIGRQTQMEAIATQGLLLDGLHIHERIRLAASTGIAAARAAQVVLFCVKTPDTESAAQALRPHLGPGSVVLSLQNGVDNVQRMYSAARIEAIPAVVYVAAAMVAPGHVRHSGRGDLVVGSAGRAVAAMFEHAGVPCRISENIAADLWAKMVMNCAFNAISALGQARYARMVRSPSTRKLMEQVIVETVSVARAEGVELSEAAMIDAAFELGEAMAEARSSTAQDIARGKRTEIDSLNGYLAGRGVPVPVNETLHRLVKLLEESGQEECRHASTP